MDSRASIHAFLARARAQLQRRSRRRVGLICGSAALWVLAAAGLWAAHVGPAFGTAVFAAALIALIAAASVFIIGGVLHPRRQWRTDQQVARFVGTRAPGVASDLLSAVELPAEAGARISSELIQALIEGTERRLHSELPSPLVPPAHRAPALALAATAAGFAILLWGSPLALGLGNLVTAAETAPFGGATLSSDPLLADLEVVLEYPAYTQRGSVILPGTSGDFRALAGTRAQISGTAPEGAESVSMIVGRDEGNRVPLTREGDRFQARLAIDDELEYRFLVVMANGERVVEARPRRIEIEPDKAPTVELYAPADELDVAELRRIELAYVAEDDFGIATIELVWTQDGREERKTLADKPGTTAQDKFLWDLTEIDLVPGSRISYFIEVTDGDTVSGPNRTRSKSYALRVFSPREKHEELLASQEELFERLVALLGGRLTVAVEDLDAHRPLLERTQTVATQIGTLLAALEDDDLADRKLLSALRAIRDRLDRSAKREGALIESLAARAARADISRELNARFGPFDAASAAELEDDVLTLADWIDRQRVENLLAVGDEISAHQTRLKELLAELKRTGSEEARRELLREIRKLRRRLAELEAKQQSLPKDVMDQFVNSDALELQESKDCLEEVAQLIEAGDIEMADRKLQECIDEQNRSQIELEQALSSLRGERFESSQKKLDEMRSELADLTRDQQQLSERASKLWERYAERADDAMADSARETRKSVAPLLRQLKRRVAAIDEQGLTLFSQEEKAVVERRLGDLERMLERGDLAEALAQAREAATGLSTMEAETDDAMEASGGTRRGEEALDAIERARRSADELVDELAKATPSPDEIMSRAERAEMSNLSKQQRNNRKRAETLQKRLSQLESELPGKSSETLRRALDGSLPHMRRAENDMRNRDPSGSRIEAREALESLREGQEQLRRAARNAGRRQIDDEPVRIPGADEYKAPERFREDILDAMKEHEAPEGYKDLIRRYYEELVK